MKTRKWLAIVCGLVLAVLFSASNLPGSNRPDPGPRQRLQSVGPDECFTILKKTAERLNWLPSSYTIEDGSYYCELDYEGSEPKITLTLTFDVWDWESDCTCAVCQGSDSCACIDFHGNEGEYYPGFFIRFCDASCQMSFSANSPEINPAIDFYGIAEAMAASAQELGCFQLDAPPPLEPTREEPTTETPGGDSLLPVETPEGRVPGESPPDLGAPPGDRIDLGKTARNPLVPLGGAIFGTLIGILISMLRTWLTPGSTPTQPPAAPPQGPVLPQDPHSWRKWENNLPDPGQDPLVAEPTLTELRTHRLDAAQSKAVILDGYHEDIPAWRQVNVDPSRVHFVGQTEFNRKYQEIFKQDNSAGVTGLADPNTSEAYIDQDNGINYTAVHEELHLFSNSEYGRVVKTAMDEATTEYFTLKLAEKNRVARISLYTLNDSTKVIDEIVKRVGEPAVRRAYFGEGPDRIEELRRKVDEQLGSGAFDKVIDLMDRGKHLHARELLRGTNLPPQPQR